MRRILLVLALFALASPAFAQLLLGGSGAPNASSGSEGQFYFNIANGNVYGPKAFGAWPSPSTPAYPTVVPGGSTTQIQFNDASAFAGDSGLTYNKTTNAVAITGSISSGSHFLNTSAVPVASTCGTTPAVTANSTDSAGQFTTGTDTPSACTLTFAIAYPTAAFCTISPANAAAAGAAVLPYISATSEAAFTITLAVGTSSAAFNYTCGGR